MTMESTHSIYQVIPDFIRFPDQWFLDDPRAADDQEIDARDFTEGRPYEGPLPARVPVYQPGREVAFALSSFDMPVVSSLVADAIERVAAGEAEFFPVKIAGAKGQYQILNVICRAECLDEARSEFTMWTEADNYPEMMGNYKMISTIRVDPARTEGHHIFRIARWTLALLVSDTLKKLLEDIPKLGVVFEPVV
jgi:hypothetical protein